jgi:hypothetical protein
LVLVAMVKHQLVRVAPMAQMVPILFLLLLPLLEAAAGVIMAQSLAQAVDQVVERRIVFLVVALVQPVKDMLAALEIIVLVLAVAVREQ